MADAFYKNFEMALSKLKDFCTRFNGSEVERAGIIQAFEFTYEQCWKAIQKKAGEEGVSIASPKKAFEWALQNGWLLQVDENSWLDILSDRNLTSHTYRLSMAELVSEKVISIYQHKFNDLLTKMKS